MRKLEKNGGVARTMGKDDVGAQMTSQSHSKT